MRVLLTIVFIWFTLSIVYAQEGWAISLADEKVSYKTGDSIRLNITIDSSQYALLQTKKALLTYFEEGTNKIKQKECHLTGSFTQCSLEGASSPQVLRIEVQLSTSPKSVKKQLGVVFDSEKIIGTTHQPEDFLAFWKKQLAPLRNVDMKPTMLHSPTLSNTLVDVYEISYQIDNSGSRFYGTFSIPKNTNDKLPVIIVYPGAGVRGYGRDERFTKLGYATLQLGVHGVPVTGASEYYNALARGALDGYAYYNLQSAERYYFNRVIKGCVQALDFVSTLENVDSTRIFATGSSQGGALSLMVTALDNRVKAVAAYCPALCQTNGSVYGKAEGWPKPAKFLTTNDSYGINCLETISYYDVVNFTPYIKVPVFMTWGLIDDVTPATSIFSAYNVLTSNKQLFLKPDVAHANHPEQVNLVSRFFRELNQ